VITEAIPDLDHNFKSLWEN